MDSEVVSTENPMVPESSLHEKKSAIRSKERGNIRLLFISELFMGSGPYVVVELIIGVDIYIGRLIRQE